LPGFDLDELGWSPVLADNLDHGLVPGRVAAAHRAAYDVWTATGAVRSRLPGRLMHDGLDVGVGDWVGLGDGLIRTVLPRRSAIVRNSASNQQRVTHGQTLAANVDVAFVVSSLGPDLEPRRIERYLVTIWESGATPEIVLTKADRLDDPWSLVAEVEALAVGVPVHIVSALTGQGCAALRARIGSARS
jgi:ribosome biogenesis GTPase / thiamine phosphate phosphatase